MSLTSLAASLKKYVSNSKNFSTARLEDTKKHLKSFEFVSSNASSQYSESLTKKIALMCNHKYKKDNGSKLRLAEEILLSWIKSAKSTGVKISESIIKLLIMTYTHQSFLYQQIKPSKAIEVIIKATKVTDQYQVRSFKGKMLKFIAKLRLCELYIDIKKYDHSITCAQQVLEQVLKKLEKPKRKRIIEELGMAAVTAFYRIGICHQYKGNKKSAEQAFENANLIGKRYLNNSKILLELDYEMIHHRLMLKNQTLEKPQKPTLQIPSQNTTKNIKPSLQIKINEVSSETPKSQTLEIQSRPRRSVATEKVEVRLPGRYYSNEDLQRLQIILNQESNHEIINTDNFFFKKLSKTLAISGDLKKSAKKIRDGVNQQLSDIWKHKEMLKKKKKVTMGLLASTQKFDLEGRICNIEEDFENEMKYQDLKIKSKLKTTIYKKLLRSINYSGKAKAYPSQKLFFRPPEQRRASQLNLTRQPMSFKQSPLLKEQVEDLNHEIEDQMEELMHEIQGTENPKNIKNLKLQPVCALATSTVDNGAKTRQLKKSITRYLENYTPKRVSFNGKNK
ncbi:hypothetical protein SteCoe_12293 [Stentor coeruleus]|uniref:Uncharacterized protein n=1 Tax=Stentor coeruleus TaxID=5963 RepID=A0A1R2CB84_9CILI|nr:hypothetical protein SteCoe_12293 [Stentor coeruleus]